MDVLNPTSTKSATEAVLAPPSLFPTQIPSATNFFVPQAGKASSYIRRLKI